MSLRVNFQTSVDLVYQSVPRFFVVKGAQKQIQKNN